MARETSDVLGPIVPRAARGIGGELAEKLEWLRATPFWAVSALVHLLVLLALLAIIVRDEPRREPEDGGITFRVTPPIQPLRPPPPPKTDPYRPSGTSTREMIPGAPIEELDEAGLPDVPPDLEPQKGRPDSPLARGPTESPFDRDSLSALGPGPAGGARSGDPDGTGQDPIGGSPGGPKADAVDRALDWLLRHQDPDGSWKARDFTSRCAIPCRNEDPGRHGDGRGQSENDIGVTGLAILAFAGAGRTHRGGVNEDHIPCVRNAVQYLKRSQVLSADPSVHGRFGPAEGESWIYGHAIATLAMAELLVMTGDDLHLRQPVEDAVKLCLQAQNPGFGWRYGVKPGENDTSITGWMVLALKTAMNARLSIPREDIQSALRGATSWIERATASNGRTGYQAPGDEGSRLAGAFSNPYPFSKEMSAMTAVGVLCRLLGGERRESSALRSGVDILLREPPRWTVERGRALSTINFYYWYYASYALLLHGGAPWERWNAPLVKCLVDNQRQGATDELGSWDPIDEWGPAGGRVYSTAMGALTLEVYYRYRRRR